MATLGPLPWACGPFFPNSLIADGDEAVLRAPEALFARELARLPLEAPPGCRQVESERSPHETTTDAEIDDLRRALFAHGNSSNDLARLILEFSRHRADLEDHRRSLERWSAENAEAVPRPGFDSDAAAQPDADPDAEADADIGADPRPKSGDARPSREPAKDRPRLELGTLPPEIPREFDLYLRGAAAWHDRRTNEARAAWTRLLALPAPERSYKSTWAAYMLGRSWHEEDPGRAMEWYDRTRRLARSGNLDTAGLAAASLGWEGQLRLRTNDLRGAMAAYLDQYAAGATNAARLSLTVVARRVANAPPEQRLAVARDPVFRRAVTAWVLAMGQATLPWDEPGRDRSTTLGRAWLDTIEETGAAEVPLAESLAVLAYQLGDCDAARGWVELAPDSPVAGWIRAKLLLREGKTDEAARAYAAVMARLPVDPPETSRDGTPDFADSLGRFDGDENWVAGRREVHGELGVLRLARGEFVPALDALLRAGYWQDAAYVAERVLELDELKAYVDAEWPARTKTTEATAGARETSETPSATGPGERIRHLLARRLTRSNRGPEANAYYPAKWRTTHARFIADLALGEAASQPPGTRARAWFSAAGLARTNGLELLATELAPDWAIWGGDYEDGPTVAHRTASEVTRLRPRPEEIARAERHHPDPDTRFHYRYQAAFLAWDAARLMPDDDPETARMLYHGGSWLKYRSPKTADLFYKALVRRCRHTELGAAADRQRWFPALDATGHPIVTRTPSKAAAPRVTKATEDAEEPPVLPEPPEAPSDPGDSPANLAEPTNETESGGTDSEPIDAD